MRGRPDGWPISGTTCENTIKRCIHRSHPDGVAKRVWYSLATGFAARQSISSAELIQIKDNHRDRAQAALMGRFKAPPEQIHFADAPLAGEALARIADLLGCSPSAFVDGGSASRETEAVELIRMWWTLDNPDDRLRVLDLARTLAQS